ncbi:hypothetical protein G4B88_010708 [Cannabis sativa]|uniref:Uncharacterized protein n=2 Tax=Cannabis sativa TaxID=3483 RepID=A0A7J6F7E4_CANSA|nr:hypothetical protein G4B88_010708 [Cannabis sativa]
MIKGKAYPLWQHDNIIISGSEISCSILKLRVRQKRVAAVMSSIGQSILMAFTVTMNKYASSNIQAVHRNNTNNSQTTTTPTHHHIIHGRRGLLLSTVVAALQVTDSKTQLLQKYLKKSEENKAKNDKERMDSYYKRNYKDYFELVEGTMRGKDGEISEAEKGILEWLQKNK